MSEPRWVVSQNERVLSRIEWAQMSLDLKWVSLESREWDVNCYGCLTPNDWRVWVSPTELWVEMSFEFMNSSEPVGWTKFSEWALVILPRYADSSDDRSNVNWGGLPALLQCHLKNETPEWKRSPFSLHPQQSTWAQDGYLKACNQPWCWFGSIIDGCKRVNGCRLPGYQRFTPPYLLWHCWREQGKAQTSARMLAASPPVTCVVRQSLLSSLVVGTARCSAVRCVSFMVSHIQ